jgi:murein DD-endopeptidase MepM/ murein hydrolase activator NlpD
MLRRFYTVMIVPHEGGALRRLSVSMNFVVSMAAIFLFCFVSSAFLAQFFLGGVHRSDLDERLRAENDRLAMENARLRGDLLQAVQKVDELSDGVEKIRQQDPQWAAMGDTSMGGARLFASESGPGLYTADGDLRSTAKDAVDKADYWLAQIEERLCELNKRPEPPPPRQQFEWPVDGAVRITSGFGPRRDPFDGSRQFHEGVDIATSYGAHVKAVESGIVIEAKRHGGYGNMVLIDHGNGRQTLYGHLRKYAVRQGDNVRRDQVIGEVGSTGRSTGPHLHFEVIENGRPVDPTRAKRVAAAR